MPNPSENSRLARGFAALAAEKPDQAVRVFRAVIKTDPNTSQAWHGLGLAVAMQGRPAEAVKPLQRAASLSPGDAVILTNLGLVQKSAGDAPGAIVALQKALAIDPRALNALLGLGDVLLAQARYAEAADILRRTLQQTPDAVETLINLGVALQKTGDLADARQALTKAVTLQPSSFEAWTNLGNVNHAEGNFAGAIEAHQRALSVGAPPAQAHFNLSTAYEALKDFDRALASLDRAIAVDPNYAEAHRNKGLIHLLRGQYEPGWRAYEWRWQCWDFEARKRPFSQPRWTGENTSGPVLVWGEQGPGDEILYGGMAADLVRAGTALIWETDPRLVPLIKRALPQCHVVPRQSPPDAPGPDVAAQIPIGSLGAVVRPNLAAFPATPLPYLKAEPSAVARLSAELRAGGAQRVIGLSWLSRNEDIGAGKSMALSDLEPLFDAPSVRWVDLQYGDTRAERAALAARKPPGLVHRDDIDLFQDLDGLAALICSCDLVVTVSNTTAHLAGALGVPTLVLVSHGARKLWYWGEGTDRTPWYPSIGILRQDAAGSWATAVSEVGRRVRNG